MSGELLDAGFPRGVRGVFTTASSFSATHPAGSSSLAADHGAGARANRAMLGRQAAVSGLAWMQQVHGTTVAVVPEPPRDDLGAGVPGTDGLVTTVPEVGLAVLAADCMPVLLADLAAGVVAAAHAGRPGLVAGVLQATVTTMVGQGAEPGRVIAVVGPSICGRCYELPPALVEELERGMPGLAATTSWGTSSIDLRRGAEIALAETGVADVRHTGGCTYEQPERFFSYRRDGTAARHGGLVVLDAAPRVASDPSPAG